MRNNEQLEAEIFAIARKVAKANGAKLTTLPPGHEKNNTDNWMFVYCLNWNKMRWMTGVVVYNILCLSVLAFDKFMARAQSPKIVLIAMATTTLANVSFYLLRNKICPSGNPRKINRDTDRALRELFGYEVERTGNFAKFFPID